MRKNTLIIALTLFANFIVAQDVCEAKEESLEDLNSITKCVIDKTEKVNSSGTKSKKLSVKISTSTRYLKGRIKKKEAVTGLAGINISGVTDLKTSSSVAESLQLKDESANNISVLMSKISKEQLKNASEFEDLDKIPLFEKCESSTKEANSQCFNEEMMSHIQKHFRYPKEALLKKIQGNVWVRFVIDEDGNVTNLKTLCPKNGAPLKEEAIRVISKLMAFKPAQQKGKNVLAKYGFPINFSLED